MKKIIKFIFLVTIYLSFSIGIANAQGFWVKFTDSNENGIIHFGINSENYEDQVYWIGVATIDHKTIYDPLLQLDSAEPYAVGENSIIVSWSVNLGESLIYDIYLTPDPNNINAYYWTSQGDAFGKEGVVSEVYIYWGETTASWEWNIKTKWFGVLESFGVVDDLQIVPASIPSTVPIPSTLWLLGSGAIALGLMRKKFK